MRPVAEFLFHEFLLQAESSCLNYHGDLITAIFAWEERNAWDNDTKWALASARKQLEQSHKMHIYGFAAIQ